MDSYNYRYNIINHCEHFARFIVGDTSMTQTDIGILVIGLVSVVVTPVALVTAPIAIIYFNKWSNQD